MSVQTNSLTQDVQLASLVSAPCVPASWAISKSSEQQQHARCRRMLARLEEREEDRYAWHLVDTQYNPAEFPYSVSVTPYRLLGYIVTKETICISNEHHIESRSLSSKHHYAVRVKKWILDWLTASNHQTLVPIEVSIFKFQVSIFNSRFAFPSIHDSDLIIVVIQISNFKVLTSRLEFKGLSNLKYHSFPFIIWNCQIAGIRGS